MKHQNIEFKTRRIQTTENKEQDSGEIGKEPDITNSVLWQPLDTMSNDLTNE